MISAAPCLLYPNDQWAATYDNQPPAKSTQTLLIEYTAHPDACFHLWDGQTIPVAQLESQQIAAPLQVIAPATQRVTLRAVEGVNVINLLASQWGELVTNVGDFDGRTTWGERAAGGDGVLQLLRGGRVRPAPAAGPALGAGTLRRRRPL